MNSRDFCFWLQGYMELTGGEYPPSVAWTLILEHLALANEDEDWSPDEFEGVVSMLMGFTSVAGNEQPTEPQWLRIVDIVQDAFEKVTSTYEELEEAEDEENDFEKIIEEIRKLPHPYTPPPPFLPPTPNPWDQQKICDPLPWQQPIITCQDTKTICSSTDSKAFCAGVDHDVSLDVACSALDSAYDSHAVSRGIGGDMYDVGVHLADSNLGDR